MNKISLAASEFVEEQIGLLGRTGWGEADARIYTPAKTEVGKSVRAEGEEGDNSSVFCHRRQLSSLPCRDASLS